MGTKSATAIKASVNYNQLDYAIIINYTPDNPNREELEKLMVETPLQLELEQLKIEKSELPSNENFEKLKKQAKELENYLQNYVSEEEFTEICKNKLKYEQ
ncbi:MAG: hypothetical protein MRERC_4c077 [Mycoplasmataceae bacterium RC_NB112A]|nr:MAG: hypothetical protein MRERC_4c077 [Mycoplasmataceae bacterium RC_NB112A]